VLSAIRQHTHNTQEVFTATTETNSLVRVRVRVKGEKTMSINDENNTVMLTNGSVIHLHSEPQSLASTTGWVTWNASLAVIRYLERQNDKDEDNNNDDNITNSNNNENTTVMIAVKGRRMADLSTGNGLVALAMAYMGAASVVATEVPACLALTRANMEQNNPKIHPTVLSSQKVLDYSWGDETCPIQGCDLVIGSDLLFIAIRDCIYDQLRKTLIDICAANKMLLFCYEERILDKEQAFMRDLEHHLQVHSVPEEQIDVGSDSTDMFYEPPSIRMYILTAKV
jgi:Lysine methyltransferase